MEALTTETIIKQLQQFGYNENDIQIAINNVNNPNDINSIIDYIDNAEQKISGSTSTALNQENNENMTDDDKQVQ